MILRALRAEQWAPFACLPLAALASPLREAPLDAALAVLAAGASLSFAYGLNAAADASTDRSRRKNPLAGRRAPRGLRGVLVALVIASVCSAIPLGIGAVLAACVSLAGGWLYSGRLRLKGWPVVGLLCNHAIFVPLLYLGPGGALDADARTMLTYAFVVLLTQNQLLHELADLPEDRRAGDITTARLLGDRSVRILCGLLGVVGVAALAFGRTLSLGGGALVVSVVVVSALAVASGDAEEKRRLHGGLALAAGALGYVGLA